MTANSGAGGEAARGPGGDGMPSVPRRPPAVQENAASALPLFRRFEHLRARIPHLPFSDRPGPVTRLSRLSERLGDVDIWMKNDGLYGSPYGGNKPRKLEFVLADARRRHAKTLITMGAIGTNHGLATALYGAQAGLKVVLLLSYEEPQADTVQHVLRMAHAGAELRYTKSYPQTALVAPYHIARCWLRDQKPPYRLGAGGSSVYGVLGYVNAAFELAQQVRDGDLPEPAAVFVPVGTGGTLAGILLGLRLAGIDSDVVGVAITRAPTAWKPAVVRLARAAASFIASRSGEPEVAGVRLDGLRITRDWLGPGFGRPSREGHAAAKLAFEEEGLVVEPVYTAKTLAALYATARSGSLEGPFLYWHTYNARPAPPVTPGPELVARIPRNLRKLLAL